MMIGILITSSLELFNRGLENVLSVGEKGQRLEFFKISSVKTLKDAKM
ncbi:hypothetical protein Avbf_19038, partial [Armadillidium vulgare]